MSLPDSLTPREHEVLSLIASGYDNHSIATALGVSHAAVEKHSGRIFTKLGLTPRNGRNARVLAALMYHGAPQPQRA